MLNKVTLIGNVGNEPDIKMMPSGSKVMNLSLATSEYWKDKDGNKQTRTEWHRITVYNENLIKIVEQYVHKGNKLYIEGSIRTRKYVDSGGVEKYSTDIVVQNFSDTIKILDSKNSASGANDSYDSSSSANENVDSNKSSSGFGGSSNDIDDEIPF